MSRNVSPEVVATYDATATADGSSCILVQPPTGGSRAGGPDHFEVYLTGSLSHLGRVALTLFAP